MADDIGEALDFVVGLAKIGGALVDGGLQIEIVVAQQRFGVVAGARRAPHQEDRDAGQHDDEARTNAGHRCRQGLTAVGIGRAQDEQPIFFRAHLAGEFVDVLHGVAADALADDPGGVVHALSPRQFDRAAEFLNSQIDKRKHLASETPLNRVVADQLAQSRQCRRELGSGFLEIGLKIRQQCREKTALRAFGAAQLQLGERYLVFDFNGVNDPARVLPRLVHQIDRAGADNRQHHEARRKQQDLADRAAARGVRPHSSLAS